MKASLELLDSPSDEDRQAILQALVAFNRSSGPPTLVQPLAIVIRGEGSEIEGGLWGHSIYDWLRIELLVVPEALRSQGIGRRLLAKAEEEARRRSCIGAWLDTFSFQARGFYEKAGYRLSGQIEDHPIGGARYILAKRLD